jgi:hypothetical protein
MKNNSASTPRERVLSALGHRTPDRIPFTWGFGATPEMAATLRAHLAPQGIDWDKLQAATEDKIHVAPAYCGPACANPSFGIWGINVRSADYGEGHYAEFTDLLDAGLDTLEAVQTDATGMEPERLKRAYGDRLSFQGAISVQHLLPHGNPTTVRVECQRLIEVLGARGGYIAAPAHAIQVGTPPENVLAMLRTVLGDDDYERAIQQAQA